MEQEAFFIQNSKYKQKTKGPKTAALEKSDDDTFSEQDILGRSKSKKVTELNPANKNDQAKSIRAFIVPGGRSPVHDKYFEPEADKMAASQAQIYNIKAKLNGKATKNEDKPKVVTKK